MDACHLLLGRPWQFDKKTMHDGHKNTCSFNNDKTHITLFLKIHPWSTKINLGSETQVRKHFLELREPFTNRRLFFPCLWLSKTNGEDRPLRSKMRSLINKLEDVFSALKNLLGINRIYYLVHWRGHPRNLSKSTFFSTDNCGKLATFNLENNAMTDLWANIQQLGEFDAAVSGSISQLASSTCTLLITQLNS